MQHARTIAMASTLLADGRAKDVAQMIDPLLEPVEAPAASTGQIMLRALMARVEIVHRGNPSRVFDLLPPMKDVADLCTCVQAEVALWRGWGLARQNTASDKAAQALRLLDDAQELFDSIHDPTGRCWALLGRARAYFALDEYALMRHVLDDAAALPERLQDVQAKRWLHELSIPALRFDGRYAKAEEHVDALRSLAVDRNDRRVRGRAAAHMAALQYDLGQPPSTVIEAAETAVALLRQLDPSPSYPLLTAYHAHVGALLRRGTWPQALETIDEAEEALLTDPVAQAHLQTLRARISLRRGNLDRVNELLDDLIEQAHHLPHGLQRSHVALLYGEVLARRNQLDEAQTWVKRAHRNALETGHRGNQLRTLLTLIRIAAAQGDLETARAYFKDTNDYDDYFSVLPHAVRRFAAEGALAQIEGREEDALHAYRNARSAASMIGARYREASLQLALAQLEDDEAAHVLATEAHATFEDVNAQEETEVAKALIDTATAGSDDPPSSSSPPFGPALASALARASLSMPLVAKIWLRGVERLLPDRWAGIYRVPAEGIPTLVHEHGSPPESLAGPPSDPDTNVNGSVQWLCLHSSAPAFYLGVEVTAEEPSWQKARSQMKPWIPLVELAFERALLHQQAPSSDDPDLISEVDGFVAESTAMQSVANNIRRARPSHSPVLITGESGTGKRFVARTVHETSERAAGPLERVSCTSLQHEPTGARLFGAVEADGSLTPGAVHAADGGTLLIEDVDALPSAAQSSLLHLLEGGEVVPSGGTDPVPVDVRVIATTSVDLAAHVRNERFRPSLYNRLRIIPLHVPPLRERRADIPLLVRHFLDTLRSEGSALASVTESAMNALRRYNWPGNVRQLRNEIERVLVYVQSEPAPTIDRNVLLDTIVENAEADDVETFEEGPATILHPDQTLSDVLARTEQSVIEQVLQACDGQITASADVLGLTRQGLYKKMKRLDIDASSFQSTAEPAPPSS